MSVTVSGSGAANIPQWKINGINSQLKQAEKEFADINSNLQSGGNWQIEAWDGSPTGDRLQKIKTALDRISREPGLNKAQKDRVTILRQQLVQFGKTYDTAQVGTQDMLEVSKGWYIAGSIAAAGAAVAPAGAAGIAKLGIGALLRGGLAAARGTLGRMLFRQGAQKVIAPVLASAGTLKATADNLQTSPLVQEGESLIASRVNEIKMFFGSGRLTTNQISLLKDAMKTGKDTLINAAWQLGNKIYNSANPKVIMELTNKLQASVTSHSANIGTLKSALKYSGVVSSGLGLLYGAWKGLDNFFGSNKALNAAAAEYKEAEKTAEPQPEPKVVDTNN